MKQINNSKTLLSVATLIISFLTTSVADSQGLQSNILNKSIITNNEVLSKDELDTRLSTLINRYGLLGKPIADHPIPDIQSPKAQLGMKLFFSKTLGGDNTTACASCHHPMLGGGDNLSLSIGVDADEPDVLGVGRQTIGFKHTQIPRNAPTTFNVAFWKKTLFHDARIQRIGAHDITTPDMPYPKADALAGDTLVQAQVRFPITSIDEMRGGYLDNSLNQTLRRALATRLKKNWLDDFRYGFSDPKGTAEDLITEQNYSEALAEYERSQVFINNPWKSYIEGDINAISDSAKQGALLFYTEHEKGGAGCASCHSGDFFTNEKAYNTAMPQIGAGKKNGKTGSNDYGCNLVSNKENDKFRFRTPTLLNVEVTGPWGHDGAYTSLEAITKHMLSPTQAVINYRPQQLTQKNINIKDVYKNTLEAVNAGIDLKAKDEINKDDVKHLVSFLKTLTDPCVKDRACLSKWIPKASDNDPDGMMLHAVDSITGKPL